MKVYFITNVMLFLGIWALLLLGIWLMERRTQARKINKKLRGICSQKREGTGTAVNL